MKKLNQSGFHLVPLLLAVVVIGAIGFAGYRVLNKDNNKTTFAGNQSDSKDSQQPSFADQYKGLCKERDVKFTSSPLPMSQLGYIEPLGKVSDGHVTPTDHVYVGPTSQQVPDNTYDVLMPADGTVIDVGAMPSQYIGDRNQETAAEDHRIVIAHSCRYFSIFIHVHKLSPEIAAATGQMKPNENKRISVELKAGDKIGKIGGNPVDWTPLDTSRTLKGFIKPEQYAGESWKIYTISPFELYTGDLKKQLEAKSLRTVAPLGGRIDWDEKGKLVGNWFREGTGGYSNPQGGGGGRYWDGHLSIAPDYIDGKTAIVSIGNWTGQAQQFAAKGGLDPAKISSKDGVVKVEVASLGYNLANGSRWSGGAPQKGMIVDSSGQTQGTILFQVQSGDKLKVEKFPGKSASQVSGFTSAAETYNR